MGRTVVAQPKRGRPRRRRRSFNTREASDCASHISIYISHFSRLFPMESFRMAQMTLPWDLYGFTAAQETGLSCVSSRNSGETPVSTPYPIISADGRSRDFLSCNPPSPPLLALYPSVKGGRGRANERAYKMYKPHLHLSTQKLFDLGTNLSSSPPSLL